MEEIWKAFRDTIYLVSNMGYVKNSLTGKLLAGTRTRQGYIRVAIWQDKKPTNIAVHRMIAECFLLNEENKPVVNHRDGNPSNNRLDNLEWATISENVKHAYATGLVAVGEDCTVAKLNESQVIEIIGLAEMGFSVVEVANQFNVTPSAVSHIWNNVTWKHLTREKIKTPDYKGKLKASDIPVIRSMFATKSNAEIAKHYGIHPASVHNIRSGKNWSNY